jgi:tRNA 2-selenouridine synthase
MTDSLHIKEFLQKSLQIPIIDVRSEGEFAQGHIPSAINIPLFDNQERAEVGTIYKNESKEEAILRGLEFVGPKMADFVRKARSIALENQVLVHCWRGGMRSGSFAWLMHTAGLSAFTLQGGYKAYRQYVIESFNIPAQILILGGETGSGKTEILRELAKLGEQVIDLEAMAHHKGSAFGSIGQSKQPSSEHFENMLSAYWAKLDFNKVIWLEDESISIGSVQIPQNLWFRMKSSPILRITVPRNLRIQRLVNEYGNLDKDALIQSIIKIQKKLGGLAVKQAIEALESGNPAQTADIILQYYDNTYNLHHQKRNFHQVYFVRTDYDDPAQNARLLLEYQKNNLSEIFA